MLICPNLASEENFTSWGAPKPVQSPGLMQGWSSPLTLQSNAINLQVCAVELCGQVVKEKHEKVAQLVKHTASKQENLTSDP